MYNKLDFKIKNVNTSAFVLKTKYNTEKAYLGNKIPDTIGPVKKTDYNAKITEIEGKIPSICGLATNAALTAVENKIPYISSLVKKTDYNTKITEIEKKLTDHNHDKYITTPEFNTLAADVFNERLKQADLVKNTDFDDNLKSLNQKIKLNKTRHLVGENELKKLKTFDSIYFTGKSHLEEEDTQNYLVFHQIKRYFKGIVDVGNGSLLLEI